MIAWRPASIGDLREVTPQPMQGAFRVERLHEESIDQALTFWVDGFPEGVVGLQEVAPGVAQGWAVLSERALEHPVRLTREILRQLDRLPHRRIQILVYETHGKALRWARVLGFEVEGLLRRLGPEGQSYWVMGRLRG